MFRHLVLMSVILMTSLYAVDVLSEDFSNPTFPPPGWSATSFFKTHGTWIQYWYGGGWNSVSDHQNPYAYGSTMAYWTGFPPPDCWGVSTAVLTTPIINMNAGDLLEIIFDGKAIPVPSGNCTFNVWLTRTGNLYWSESLPSIFSTTVQHFTLSTSTVTENATDYSVGFIARSYAYCSSPWALNLMEVGIDNIVITKLSNRNTLKVQPTSLGSIKAAYK